MTCIVGQSERYGEILIIFYIDLPVGMHTVQNAEFLSVGLFTSIHEEL